MTSHLWQSVDAARLKSLREQANLRANEFARTHAISTAQLHQLEQEGDSAFYSSVIKYQVGKRLLSALGETTAAESHSASVNAPLADPHPAAAASLNQKTQTLAVLAKIAEVSTRDYDPPFYKALAQAIVLCWREHAVFSRLVVLCLVLLVGVRVFKAPFVALQEKYFMNDAAVVVEVISNNVDKKPASVAESSASSPVIDVATSVASAPQVVSSAGELFLLATTKDCRWTQTPVTLKSPSPSKPAEYVYLMAINDISACVVDQNKRVTTHSLKAGEGQTVNGQVPFRIYSERMADLKIFFQGHHVIMPTPDVTDVILVESPLAR